MATTDYGNGFKVTSLATLTEAGPFPLLGGRYGISCKATFGGGDIILSILGPDGTTYVPIRGPNSNNINTFQVSGYFPIYFPPCEVKIATDHNSSAANVSVIPISNRR